MSRNKRYQQLLNSKRWKQLRWEYLSKHPVCERCGRRSAIDLHHITPVETGRNDKEMEQLCYSSTNIMALCIPCHIEVHKEERSHTKEGHQQRVNDRLKQWIARHDGKR